MRENGKTRGQLADDVTHTRERVAEVEASKTRLKLLEKELRESEQKYHTLAERANDGIMIVQDGTVKYANKRLAQVGGYTVKAMIDTPLVNYIHPDAVTTADDRQGQPAAGVDARSVSGCETVLKRKKGGDVYAELNSNKISYHGKPAELVLVRDITERKRAQRREREYLRDLALLSRNATDLLELSPADDIYQFTAHRLAQLAPRSVVIVSSVDEASSDFHIREVLGVGERMDSLVKILGREPVGIAIPISGEARETLTSGRLERMPNGLSQLADGGLPKAICCAIEQLLDLGDVYAMGFSWKGSLFGSAIVLMRKGTALRNPGTVEAFVSQVSVALQRKQVEAKLTHALEELRRSNADLEQFVNVISHDLREPLRMVTSYVELLERRYRDSLGADANDFIGYAVDGARRMQELLDDVLAYSQVGTRGKPFQATDFGEFNPVFSPDGRWMAYDSNESGRIEIYVRAFPATGGKWQVSDGGGALARWSADGSELFYRTDDGLMAVEIDGSGDTFQVGTPYNLFKGPFLGGTNGISVGGYVFPDYTVTADGERFVMFAGNAQTSRATSVRLVTNWFDELRRLTAAGSR